MIKTVCFTGHRPSKLPGGYDYNSIKNKELSYELEKEILTVIEKGATHFICGGALGIDQIAFNILNDLRNNGCDITIEIAIPFKLQYSNWVEESKKIYFEQLKLANKLTFVDEIEKYNRNFPIEIYHPMKMEQRNRYMVDNADIVIAVWDGTNGGTHNCIKYAKKKEKPIIIIDKIFKE